MPAVASRSGDQHGIAGMGNGQYVVECRESTSAIAGEADRSFVVESRGGVLCGDLPADGEAGQTCSCVDRQVDRRIQLCQSAGHQVGEDGGQGPALLCRQFLGPAVHGRRQVNRGAYGCIVSASGVMCRVCLE